MIYLSETDVLKKIDAGEPLSARLFNNGFDIKIDRYGPCVGTAIHHGHHIPPWLEGRMCISENERRFEEDPHTGDFIEQMPITLIVNHSRYYYDLNRRPQQCIYEEAWGKNVWKKPFSEHEVAEIHDMHSCYYRILDRLITHLEEKYARILLYDIHSYNYSRIKGFPPLFNIGTHSISRRYKAFLEVQKNLLSTVKLPGEKNRTAFDEVFKGKGYQAAFVREKHPESLCVPLEVKKVFMSEQHFELYPERYTALKHQLNKVFSMSADRFQEMFF